jgi:hypothetical protein
VSWWSGTWLSCTVGWVRISAEWNRFGRLVSTSALMSDMPRKNGWTIAEHPGDATPDRTQRLLNHAVWDTGAAVAEVRGFVVQHLADGLAVATLDESGQEKQGSATAASTWGARAASPMG